MSDCVGAYSIERKDRFGHRTSMIFESNALAAGSSNFLRALHLFYT